MEDFLMKLQKISNQYNNLLEEKKEVDKKIQLRKEKIKNLERTRLEKKKEAEQKKNKLLKYKNNHYIKCQKLEELNGKLNENLLEKQKKRKQDEKRVILRQIETINKTFHLLKNVQKLNDAIGEKNEYYKSISENINNNNFHNRKILHSLNCFLHKNVVSIQSKEGRTERDKEEKVIEPNRKNNTILKETDSTATATTITSICNNTNNKSNDNQNYKKSYNHVKNFKIIPTKEINNHLINLFSQKHSTLNIEKQQFLFVLFMNILTKISYAHRNETYEEKNNNKSRERIHNFLCQNYIFLQ